MTARAAASFAAMFLLLAGCVVEKRTTTFGSGGSGFGGTGSSDTAGTPPRAESTFGARPPAVPGDSSDGATASSGGSDVRAIRVEMTPLGTVPYDEFTLPLIQPSGSFVATQIGQPQPWPTVLASPGAPDAQGSRVSIYAMGFGQPQSLRVHQFPDGTLLGREADDQGFLVERVRADGSRAIGKAAWVDGRIEWITDDGLVNAFATMSRNGAFAWSRRPIDRAEFDLVIRSGGNDIEIPSSEGWSWMLPSFSDDGTRVFALRLRDGVLQLACLPIGDAAAALEGIETITISMRADETVAYQSMAPVRAGAAGPPGSPAILFFDPTLGGMTIWEPETGRHALLARIVRCGDPGPGTAGPLASGGSGDRSYPDVRSLSSVRRRTADSPCVVDPRMAVCAAVTRESAGGAPGDAGGKSVVAFTRPRGPWHPRPVGSQGLHTAQRAVAPNGVKRPSLLRANDQHRTRHVPQHGFGDAAHQDPIDAGAAVGADHDEVGRPRSGEVSDLLRRMRPCAPRPSPRRREGASPSCPRPDPPPPAPGSRPAPWGSAVPRRPPGAACPRS